MENPESLGTIDNQEFHRQSFWLYTVIVGLSVEEALRHVLPHVGELFSVNESSPQSYSEIIAEFLRLSLFLTLVVRFYLGSVRYYSLGYLGENSDTNYQTKSYPYDFFFGLIHFSSFLALSLSIDFKQPQTTWLFWLSFILLYDFIWLLSCRKYDTVKIITFWTYLNGVNFIGSIALFFISKNLLANTSLPENVAKIINEFLFMLPIIIISFLDLKEVLVSDPVLPRFVSNALKRK